MNEFVHIKSISELHNFFDLPTPVHPLVSVIPNNNLDKSMKEGIRYISDLYQITLKDGAKCDVGYGRSTYDFEDGTLAFLAPNQSFSTRNATIPETNSGWLLAFNLNFSILISI